MNLGELNINDKAMYSNGAIKIFIQIYDEVVPIAISYEELKKIVKNIDTQFAKCLSEKTLNSLQEKSDD